MKTIPEAELEERLNSFLARMSVSGIGTDAALNQLARRLHVEVWDRFWPEQTKRHAAVAAIATDPQAKLARAAAGSGRALPK